MNVADREEGGTRYSAAQLVEAIGRTRGDSRYWLVEALGRLPGPELEPALTSVLDMELRPDERYRVRCVLARLRPDIHRRSLIVEGLAARSLHVQQLVVADLPSLARDGLEPDDARVAERWLHKRMRSPARANNWALWEVTGIALALLPLGDPVAVWKLWAT
jgi:hypothetical protein